MQFYAWRIAEIGVMQMGSMRINECTSDGWDCSKRHVIRIYCFVKFGLGT